MIYVALWPTLRFTVVRASSEEDAFWKFDQFADPSAARIFRYDGPLCFNFNITCEEKAHAEYPNVSGAPDGDEGIELVDFVLRKGYPHTYAYYEAVYERRKEPQQSEARAAMYLDREELSDATPEGNPDVDLEQLREAMERTFGNRSGQR